MIKQLSLFPELANELVSNLDDKALEYAKSLPVSEEVCETNTFIGNIKDAYTEGAKAVLADIIDLLKKYTDLHEN